MSDRKACAADELQANVRANHYRIVRAPALCPRCGARGELLALLVAPGHELRWQDQEPAEAAAEEWTTAGGGALLFHLEALSARVIERLSAASPGFRRAGNDRGDDAGGSAGGEAGGDAGGDARVHACGAWIADPGGESLWSNHCARCGHPWPDEDCFCEPGGAFLPTNETEAAALRLEPVAEPLEARVGGYAPDPEFLAIESRE